MKKKVILFIVIEFLLSIISLIFFGILNFKLKFALSIKITIFLYTIFELLLYNCLFLKIKSKRNIVLIIIGLERLLSLIDDGNVIIMIIQVYLQDIIIYLTTFIKRDHILDKNTYMNLLLLLPHPLAHKLLYKKNMGKKLNLKNPRTFDEKLQWLMSYKYGNNLKIQSDKELVKKYIEDKNIKNLNIPKTYFIVNKKYDINDFPNKFVLKANHGSGKVFVCKNKNDFDFDSNIKELKKLLKVNYTKYWLEYQYKNIKPLIMCEEYLDDGTNVRPIDYKFMCSNGKVFSILVCSNREKKLNLDMYSTKWEKLDYVKEKYQSNKKIRKPSKLKEMIEISKTLSKGYPFVRVDLYQIKGKIYFGELTFTSGAGMNDYYTDSFQNKMGKFIKLK